MSDEDVEALELALEDAANFLRGLWLDPAVPRHAKAAIMSKAKEIDTKLKEIDPETYDEDSSR